MQEFAVKPFTCVQKQCDDGVGQIGRNYHYYLPLVKVVTAYSESGHHDLVLLVRLPGLFQRQPLVPPQ